MNKARVHFVTTVMCVCVQSFLCAVDIYSKQVSLKDNFSVIHIFYMYSRLRTFIYC